MPINPSLIISSFYNKVYQIACIFSFKVILQNNGKTILRLRFYEAKTLLFIKKSKIGASAMILL